MLFKDAFVTKAFHKVTEIRVTFVDFGVPVTPKTSAFNFSLCTEEGVLFKRNLLLELASRESLEFFIDFT